MKKVAWDALGCAILGGGCFWCLEAVYQQIKGVKAVESGYAGGRVHHPSYHQVCSGKTDHAEVIKVVFDETQISYRLLLEIFFVIHDPTTLNRQGNDIGSQYRSIIFATTPKQFEIALSIKAELTVNQVFIDPILTEIHYIEEKNISNTFWPAETVHRNYYRENQSQDSYCAVVITPKLEKFRKKFPQYLYS